MTQTLTRMITVAAFAGAVTACATTPAYPTHAAPSSAMSAPVATAAPATPPPTVQAGAPPAASAVESQPLPPVSAPASNAAPQPSRVATPPPASTVAAEPEAAPPPAPMTSAAPPPPRGRPVFHYLASGKVVEAKGMYRDYEVQKGDHVDAIARDLQTTRAVIVEANHLKAPYPLKPGQHIKVPVAKAYEAQAGDSLTVIAKRFDVSLGELSALNDLPAHGHLRAGERIALPANFHDRGPVKARASEEEFAVAPIPPAKVPAKAKPTPYRAYAAAPTMPPPSTPPATSNAAPTPYIAHPYTPPPRAAYTPIAPPAESARAVTDSEITAAAKGRFLWPVRGDIISGFGAKGVGRRNDGVDLRAPLGTVVHSAAAGEVVYAGNQVPGFGNLVLVKHADGWVTAYAHLDKLSVQMRESVVQGQEVGQVGATGGVAEPQLHFEVRYAPSPAEKAKPVDPVLVLPRREG